MYRYLREYSIPHLRNAGRISIPEDSFDRIRVARDLHKEGLSTESVRRQLREDTGELDRTLDRLHQTLESLREDFRERTATDEVALSPTLRTILARQSLLMSAMFNLTEMVEELLLASGKPRKPLSEDLRIHDALPEREARELPGFSEKVPPTTHAVSAPVQGSAVQPPAARPTGFGSLGRRRRRGVLAALLLGACLAWAAWALIGAGNTGSSVPRVAQTADELPDHPMAAPDETTSKERATAQRESDVEAAAGGPEQERRSDVPDVSGRSLEEAVRLISGAGFEVARINTRASQADPKTAIRTKPPSGAPAKAGAPVILTISGGPSSASSKARGASASATASASASASAGYAN